MGFNPDKFLAETAPVQQQGGFNPDKFLAETAPPPETRRGEAFVEGIGKGATLGALPYVQAGVGQAVDYVAGKFDENYPQEDYSKTLQSFRDRGASLREQHPGLTLAGELVGGALPGMGISKGVAMVGGKIIPQAVQNFGRAMPLVQKVAQGATEGAIGGAAYTPDQGADFGQRLDQAKFGAKLGGAIPLVFGAAGKAVDLVRNGPMKALSVASGVKEDVLKEFYADPKKFLNAPGKDEVISNVQKVIANVQDAVDNGSMAYDEAKSVYKDFAKALKDTRTEAHKGAKEALRAGLNQLDDAYKGSIDVLKSKPSPVALQPDVNSAIGQLKNKVQEGSDASYAILENDPKAYHVRSAGKVLRKFADEMNIQAYEAPQSAGLVPGNASYGAPKAAASPPVTAESRGVQSAIRSFADMLEQTPEMVPAKELKKILQQIDNSGQAQYDQPGFDKRVSQAYKMVRAVIDEGVKSENPAYREKMLEVAKNTGLLEDAISSFGTPDKAIGKLASVATPKGKLAAESLNKLGAATGKDFNTPIQDYIQTQQTLKSPTRLLNIKTGLPEFKQAQKLQGAESLAKRAANPKEIERIARSSDAAINMNKAGEALTKAQDVKRQFVGWTQQNAENKIKQVMRGNSFAKDQLAQMGKMADQDFVAHVNALRVNSAFTKEATQGSRNVNFWALLGMGAASGTGPVGPTVGAATGYLLDKFGPKLAKQILIGLSNLKGQPTVQSLSAAGIKSQSAIQWLVKDFAKAIGPAAQSYNSDSILRRLGQNDEPKRDPAGL